VEAALAEHAQAKAARDREGTYRASVKRGEAMRDDHGDAKTPERPTEDAEVSAQRRRRRTTPAGQPVEGSSTPLLTYKELVERWRVSRQTIHKLVKAGRLKATYVGGSVRFHIEEVERYEQSS
jgi:excisionase family DNA binding protein